MSTRFTQSQRLVHWVMAFGIVAMLFIGVAMVATIAPIHLGLVAAHERLGMLILLLVIIRLLLRIRFGAPPLPPDMPRIMRVAAVGSHAAFYVLMIAMPLLGWGMLSAADYPVVIFGVRLPQITPIDPSLHSTLWTAHRLLAFLFFLLLLAHVAAALFHAWVRKDGVFDAMAP